jgi:hypothetical protein
MIFSSSPSGMTLISAPFWLGLSSRSRMAWCWCGIRRLSHTLVVCDSFAAASNWLREASRISFTAQALRTLRQICLNETLNARGVSELVGLIRPWGTELSALAGSGVASFSRIGTHSSPPLLLPQDVAVCSDQVCRGGGGTYGSPNTLMTIIRSLMSLPLRWSRVTTSLLAAESVPQRVSLRCR